WRFPSSVPSRRSSSSAFVHPASADFLCSFCWGRLLKGPLSNLCTRGPSAECTRTMCHMDQGAGSSRSLDLSMWMDSNSCWIRMPDKVASLRLELADYNVIVHCPITMHENSQMAS
ncbi:hypothetical protein B296_00019246, partial [Ensete ventricosum]